MAVFGSLSLANHRGGEISILRATWYNAVAVRRIKNKQERPPKASQLKCRLEANHRVWWWECQSILRKNLGAAACYGKV